MATRREILENKLPKDVAEKAIQNAERYWPEEKIWLGVECTGSIKEVLMGAFLWADTSEGFIYWDGICDNLKR